MRYVYHVSLRLQGGNMHGWGKYQKKDGDITCSPSRLITFREDPVLYKAQYIDKVTENTKSMDFGTAVHSYVLEPQKFAEKYQILPEKTAENDLDSKQLEALCVELGLKKTGTKAEKIARIREVAPLAKQYDELLAEMPQDRISLPPDTLNACKTISERIMAHPKVGQWVSLADKEKRGWFTHESGIVMRFQIDCPFEYKDAGVICDLKVHREWNSKWFDNWLYDSGTYIQLACYREAMKKIEGKVFRHFLVISVEPTFPYRVRYREIDEASIDKGLEDMNKYLYEFKERTINNDWSERAEDLEIKTVGLRAYHFGEGFEV